FPAKLQNQGVLTSSITNEIMQLYTDREVLNMGLCSRYKSLTCNSCSMHCQIMPEESPRLQYCANSCFDLTQQ
ncbi:hypothetical protein D4012_21925, partial [Shigella flexneri]|nr:hypothetical protein [Shigella flexneri]